MLTAKDISGVDAMVPTPCKDGADGWDVEDSVDLEETERMVSNLIRDAKTVQIASVMQTGKNVGMQTLDDAIQDLLNKKWISPEEAYDKSIDKNRFAKLLKTPPDALQ